MGTPVPYFDQLWQSPLQAIICQRSALGLSAGISWGIADLGAGQP